MMMYIFGLISCAISMIAAFGLGENTVGLVCGIAALAFYFAYAERKQRADMYEEAELVHETCQMMWDDEGLTNSYTLRIAEWLEHDTYAKIIRYVKSFTSHDLTPICGEDEEGRHWVVITFYPFDYQGISLIIFLRSDMSYVITVEENESYVTNLITTAMSSEPKEPLDGEALISYALKWRFADFP